MMLWFLLGCSAPVVFTPAAEVPSRIGPTVELPFVPSHPAGIAAATLTVHGRTLPVADNVVQIPADLPSGPTVFTLTAEPDAWFGAEASLVFGANLDLEPPTLVVQASDVGQGHTLDVRVSADEPLGTVVVTTSTDHPAAAVGAGHRSLIGVPLGAELGALALTIVAQDAVGNTTTASRTVTVEEGGFGSGGFIQLNEAQTEARKPSPALEAMRATRAAAHATFSDTQLWSGRMQAPCSGRRSSKFGRFRTYSDGASAFHEGVDIANAAGTPVHAAATGIVLVAEEMPIYGNVVIVDHGLGVVSNYNHLQSIAVAVGDTVKMGERVGKMGTTGQSTGPHLHFEVHVGGAAVDPDEWLRNAY